MADTPIEDIDTSDAQAKGASKIQPSWKNAPTRADLYNDYIAAEDGMDDFRTQLSIWAETLDGGKPLKNVKKGKSTARPRLARKQAEWKYPALSEPILGTRDLFKVSPVGGEDVAAAKQNALILNNQWATKVKRTKLIDDIVRNLVDEGTAIIKTGWEVEEGVKEVAREEPVYASPEESLQLMQQQVQAGQMSQERMIAMMQAGEPVQTGVKTVYVEEEALVKNQPTYEVCINANVTIDPTCDGVVEDALFAVHEYETSYSELKDYEYTVDAEGNEYGYYHNVDRFKDGGEGDTGDFDEFKSVESNNFEFKDNARKRLRAYEYWGYWDIQGDGVLEPIVGTWINSTLVRLEKNPFPHGRIPFSVATYMPVKREVHGEPDAELLKENQDSIGQMTRAIHDITTEQAIGQKFIDENFFPSPSQKNSYEKGNTVYYRSGFDPAKSIFKQDVQQVGSTPFDVIAWQNKDASELTGTIPFKGPSAGGKLSGTSGQRDAMDATAKRELSILRRISEAFVDMARMTIAMNQVFLSETETIRITGDEFVTIARDDLGGNFDLNVEVSTPEKDESQATQLMTLLQTNAASADPALAKMMYVKLTELWKMPDVADQISEFEPQPNPKQEELLDLEIQGNKLKNALLMKELEDFDSKIYERLSRAEANSGVDAVLKASKANQADATADKLRAEAAELDQAFLNEESGLNRTREIENKEAEIAADTLKIKRQLQGDLIKQGMSESMADKDTL